jgi:DNA-binding MarR family transcriptional regulator
MPPSKQDVGTMVAALFTLNAGLDRARRQRKGASALSLLQVVAAQPGIRPSQIAEHQQIHASLVTRQLQELEEAGFVAVAQDSADRRSFLVTLTTAGGKELRRLTEVGLGRFALFVADWEPSEVQTLGQLLEKLRASMATNSVREQRARARRVRGRLREFPESNRPTAAR